MELQDMEAGQYLTEMAGEGFVGNQEAEF